MRTYRPTKIALFVGSLLVLCAGTFGVERRVSAAEADPPPVITQLIVRVDPTAISIDAVNDVAGTTTRAASSSDNGSYLLDLPVGVDPAIAIAAIDALEGVAYVVPNLAVRPPEVDQNRIYAWRIYAWTTGTEVPREATYAADTIGLRGAHSLADGRGVVVAVLDTGVQFAHPALAGSLVQGVDLVDNDGLPAETRNGLDDDGDGQIDEGAGHGTHVAGIVHQVAPAAVIMPVRVLDDDGTGTVWSATEGMYWAASHGARVVNMSLGTHGSARPLRDAVTALHLDGVLVVAAAGNDGKDRPSFPAAAPEAIAVGSVGAGDVVSTFSNIGKWVDVMAPGENIHSTFAFPADGYAMNSGTSMASPWVAGEAALVLSVRTEFAPSQVTGVIKAGARDLSTVNPLLVGVVGAGRIDLIASLQRV